MSAYSNSVTIPTGIEISTKRLQASFKSGKTRSYQWRVKQLNGLKQMMTDNEKLFIEALKKDFDRSEFECYAGDILGFLWELDYVLKHLHTWMKPVYTKIPAIALPGTSEYIYEPYGVCLIVGAFNFPVILTLSPLVGAICAGNCAVIKPSEIAVHCEKLLHELLPQYLDSECFEVVCGGIETTQELLAQNWDKIFFTGSVRVGKIVMKAAAENLTPVSLELGGKSPTIVDENVVNMDVAVRRILWVKVFNCGQICISPDYVLCHEKVYDLFLETCRKQLNKFYKEDPENSKDYGRLITTSYAKRLANFLLPKEIPEFTIAHGGKVNIENRYIEPTLLTDIKLDNPLMNEEIFGPILPILKYKTIDDIVNIVNTPNLKNPLALYIFSNKRKFVDEVIAKVPSGGVVVNDGLMHFANLCSPFGGRGNSGIGGYHGFFSFEGNSYVTTILSLYGLKP